MKRSARVLLLVCLGCWPALWPLRAGEPGRVMVATEAGTRSIAPHAAAHRAGTFVPGELIVQFREDTDDGVIERTLREAGGARARRAYRGQRYLVTVDPSQSISEAMTTLRARAEVDYVERNAVIRKAQGSTFTPNDTRFPIQWNFKMIGAERMWAIQQGSPSVAVAVVDTGIAFEDYDDPVTGQQFRKAPDWDCRGASACHNTVFLQGHDFINNDDHANDDDQDSHGTHVASTIAEATNNAFSFTGLAFGCALMPVKVLDQTGSGTVFSVANGIDYAANFSQNGTNPVKVINMSLGSPDPSDTIQRSVDAAFAKGIVIVAAAGNESKGSIDYPAALPNVIAVGALDARKQTAFYSNFGPQLSVVAPGGDCDRNDSGNAFGADCVWQQGMNPDAVALGHYDQFLSLGLAGTSQATPHVSALAALLISQGITQPSAVRAAIEQTAERLGGASPGGRNDTYGNGLIRPAAALAGLGFNQGPN
jgi:serine protease